jgi:hypothetical protein
MVYLLFYEPEDDTESLVSAHATLDGAIAKAEEYAHEVFGPEEDDDDPRAWDASRHTLEAASKAWKLTIADMPVLA